MLKHKSKIKRMIKNGKKTIEKLEKKRNRSMASLLEAMINGVDPYPADVEFFKTYTAMIAVERENISKLCEQLVPKLDQEENLPVVVE